MNKLKIELGGKERTLKFNMLFMEEAAKCKLPTESINTQNISHTAIFIYAGIKANAIITDTPTDCTLEDCFDWAEEMLINEDTEKLDKLMNAYYESTVYKSNDDLKKKTEELLQQIGMRSDGMPLERSASGLPIITI